MNERQRARNALTRIPSSALSELEGAVQAFIEDEIGAPTPELLYRAALIFEGRTNAMRIVEAAVAHLFAALLIRRAEELRAAPPEPPAEPRIRRIEAA